MSADNGLHVVKLAHEKYGIFHYQGEGPELFREENAREVWSDPVTAIVAAHKLQHNELTEYGASASATVVDEAWALQIKARRVK